MKPERMEEIADMASTKRRVIDADLDGHGTRAASWIDSQAELAKRQADINERPLTEKECFLTPMSGRVIIQQDDVARKSSIIYTPTDKTPRPTTGKVIAVPADGGLDRFLGQKILFAQFSGICLNFTKCPNWRVLQVEEILAVFNNSDDPHELDTNVV